MSIIFGLGRFKLSMIAAYSAADFTCRHTCRTPHAGPDAPTFEILTTPNAKQQRAFELINQIKL